MDLGEWPADHLDKIHGAVTHLLLEGEQLHVATDLGDQITWDLSPFFVDHCNLLNTVWQAVPVVWRDGQAVIEPPPTAHRCRQ